MADDPRFAIERLTQAAMKLTRAQAAGVSLEDRACGRSVFRWITTTGALSRYTNCTMPRHYSPCGAAVARQRALVMRDPARFYPCIRGLDVDIGTALLVPFTREGNRAGTLWTVAAPGSNAFTTEDVRVVQVLTTFTTAMLRALDKAGRLDANPPAA